ncbi:hypothetical protein YC2023_100579 [Brassica napus]
MSSSSASPPEIMGLSLPQTLVLLNLLSCFFLRFSLPDSLILKTDLKKIYSLQVDLTLAYIFPFIVYPKYYKNTGFTCRYLNSNLD